MFINISNHFTMDWSAEQREAAREHTMSYVWEEILDIEFPNVHPELEAGGITKLAMDIVYSLTRICDKYTISPSDVTLHIMGELSLSYNLIHICKSIGYKCVVSTSRREAVERVLPNGDVEKNSIFKFVKFREV